MDTEKVKAVDGIFPKQKKNRAAKKQKDGKWSIRFIESLLEEIDAQEEEREKKQELLHGTSWIRPGRDTLEISEIDEDEVLVCERYEDIIGVVRLVGSWKSNVLYQIANAVMRDYYDGRLDERGVGELFGACYQKCIETKTGRLISHDRQYEILRLVYEFFSRGNARASVYANEREGRKLVEGCGLSWAGTTYYNSAYYYAYAGMQRRFHVLCNKIADESGLPEITFEEIRRETQFLPVGGLTFHGVFIWVQQKDNYPCNQYGMKETDREPPKHFIYLYRNQCHIEEVPRVRFLEKKMKEETAANLAGRKIWRSYTVEDGREYHNGMSYLLEGSLENERDDRMYEEAMAFLQNFRLYRVDGCVELLRVSEEIQEIL